MGRRWRLWRKPSGLTARRYASGYAALNKADAKGFAMPAAGPQTFAGSNCQRHGPARREPSLDCMAWVLGAKNYDGLSYQKNLARRAGQRLTHAAQELCCSTA